MRSDRKPKPKAGSAARAKAARRNGALGGRPRERRDGTGISWTVVRTYARLGADRELVVRAMGLQPEQLQDPVVIARLQEELDRGRALHEIDLLANVKRLGLGGPGDPPKVSAVLANLKHYRGWNKPDSGKATVTDRPDNEAAVAEIQRMLGRFRGAR